MASCTDIAFFSYFFLDFELEYSVVQVRGGGTHLWESINHAQKQAWLFEGIYGILGF